ncbi:hypothetical protein J3R83DRAFT_6913 [Lanmaoa asiatica]|nr:hypothetical protein J3R83DRAFT_6913 [Lanmaoa asiatica]
MSSRVQSCSGKEDIVETSRDGAIPARRRLVPPFTALSRYTTWSNSSHPVDFFVRSHVGCHVKRAYRTFNGAYIISAILGLGIGEVLFGRIGRRQEV